MPIIDLPMHRQGKTPLRWGLRGLPEEHRLPNQKVAPCRYRWWAGIPASSGSGSLAGPEAPRISWTTIGGQIGQNKDPRQMQDQGLWQ